MQKKMGTSSFKKCFYCDNEGKNITVDEEGEMFFLCAKHLKLFRAIYPKEGYKANQDDEE